MGIRIVKKVQPLQYLKTQIVIKKEIIDDMLLIPQLIPNISLTLSFEDISTMQAFCATQIFPAANPQRVEVSTIVMTEITSLSVKQMMRADESKTAQHRVPMMNTFLQPSLGTMIAEQAVARAKVVYIVISDILPQYQWPFDQQNLVMIDQAAVQDVNISMKPMLRMITAFS